METRVPSSPWPPAHAFLIVFLATTGGSSRLAAADEPSLQQQGCVHGGRVHRSGSEVPLENQPCLSCTCDRGRLLCHLRVCPPLPDNPRLRPGCRLQKAIGDCCARLACGDAANSTSFVQPVLTNQVARKDDDNELGHPDASVPILGRPPKKGDGKGCWVDGAHFGEGSALPSSVRCQRCYCLKNAVRCIRPTCHLNIFGCAPQYNHGSLSCCPSSYDCAALAASLSTTTESTTTMTSTTTPTPPPTTGHPENIGCLHHAHHFREGSRMPSGDVCRSCFCVRGLMKCTHAQCSTAAPGCAPILQPKHCCPVAYDCSNLESLTTSTSIPNVTDPGGSRVRDNDRVIDFAPDDVRQRYQTLRGNKNPPRGGLFHPLHRKPPTKPVDQRLSQEEPSLKPPRSTGSGIDMAAIRERGALWRRRLNATRLRPLATVQRSSGKTSPSPTPLPTSTFTDFSVLSEEETKPAEPSTSVTTSQPTTTHVTISSNDLQPLSQTTVTIVSESSLQSTPSVIDTLVHTSDETQPPQETDEIQSSSTTSTIPDQTQTTDINDKAVGMDTVSAFEHEVAVNAEPESENPLMPEQVGVVAQAEPPTEEHEHGPGSESFSQEESSLDAMMGGHEEVIPNAEPDAVLDGDVFDYFREISHVNEHRHEMEEDDLHDSSTAATNLPSTISNQHHSSTASSSTPLPTTIPTSSSSMIPLDTVMPLSPEPNNLLTRRVGMHVQVGPEGFRSPPSPRGSTRFLSSEKGPMAESTLPTSESVNHHSATEPSLTTIHQEVLGAPDAQPLPQVGVGSPEEVPGRSHSLLVIPFLPEDAVVEEGATNTSEHINAQPSLPGAALPNVTTHLLSSTNLRSLEETVSPNNQSVTRMGNLYHHLVQYATRTQGEAEGTDINHPAHIDFLGLPSPIVTQHTTPSDQWKPLAPGELPRPVAGLEFDPPLAPLAAPSVVSSSLSTESQTGLGPTNGLLGIGVTKPATASTHSTTKIIDDEGEITGTNSDNTHHVDQATGNVQSQPEEEEEAEDGNQTETEIEEDETEEPSPFLGLLSLFGFTGLGGKPAESQTDKPPLPPPIAPIPNKPAPSSADDSGWTPLQVQQGEFLPVHNDNPAIVPGQPPIGLGIVRLPQANASGPFLVGQPKEELPESVNHHHQWQTGKPIIEQLNANPIPANHTILSTVAAAIEATDSFSTPFPVITEPALKANATFATGSPESILHSLLHPLFRGDFSTLATAHSSFLPITVTQNIEEVSSTQTELANEDVTSPNPHPKSTLTTPITSSAEPNANIDGDSDIVSSDAPSSVEHSVMAQFGDTAGVPNEQFIPTTTFLPTTEGKKVLGNKIEAKVPVHGAALSDDAILSLLGLFNSHENHPKSTSQPVSHLPPATPPHFSHQPLHHPIGSHHIGSMWPPSPNPQHQPPRLPPSAHLYPQLANLHLPPNSISSHHNFATATSNLVLPQAILVTNNSVHANSPSEQTTTLLPPTSSTQEIPEETKLNLTTIADYTTESENTETIPLKSTHSTRTKPFAFNPFIFKVEGCDIYGKFYNLGDHVTDLSGSCKSCICTEYGVQCKKQC